MTRDGWIIFAAKSVRTFCYGFLGVLFPVYLAGLGLDARGVGFGVALTLLASAAFTWAVRAPAEKFGPKAALAALAGLIVVSGVLLAASRDPRVVILAAMLGNLAVGTGETGPFLTLEQVLLARLGAPERMTRLYSFYNLTGFAAAALGAALVARQGVPVRTLFCVFLAGGILQLGLYAALAAPGRLPAETRGGLGTPSGPLVRRLALLFSLDAFAGGFIVQSLVLYWFHARFGLALPTLGLIACATQLVTGASYLMAPPLARRFGLVDTMVFTHLASNLILVAVAFAPTAAAAVALLLLRHTLSQIDVPTRQAFLMAAVKDHEREAAASLTNTSRTLAQCLSPALTGWIMGTLGLSAPFLLGGGLKTVYDLMLYATIKKWAKTEAARGGGRFEKFSRIDLGQ